MAPKRRSRSGGALERQRPHDAVVVKGWTMLAHPLFLDAMERLTSASERERKASPKGPPGANTKLLAHILDLAFDKIPSDPGAAQFRHGGTLGSDRRYWFRAKTGGGRYRLFYRFHSAAKIIILAWVNDEETLRAYESKSDAYLVFAGMLESGNPPDDWNHLLSTVENPRTLKRLRELFERRPSPRGP